MPANLFNVRVYGILMNDDKEILVTDEFRMGKHITKFPGGGLEFGEGTLDCLRREFKEELNISITIDGHFYTTDFFQPSAFNNKQQVISIYYRVNSPYTNGIETNNNMGNTPQDGTQIFRWIAVKDLTIGEFTFPIDQKVAGLIIENTNY